MSMGEPYPIFIDLEASSLADDSFPIEIAWSTPDAEIHRFLIAPDPSWTDWSPEAEELHGVSRERIERNGWPVDYVCAQFLDSIGDTPLYSDAPDFDNRWLNRLFEAAKGTPSPVTIGHLDDLLIERVKKPWEFNWQAMIKIDEIKATTREKMGGRHTAGGDVGYLIQLWNTVTGRQVTTNHDVGPLPEATRTGTFVALKRRMRKKD